MAAIRTGGIVQWLSIYTRMYREEGRERREEERGREGGRRKEGKKEKEERERNKEKKRKVAIVRSSWVPTKADE